MLLSIKGNIKESDCTQDDFWVTAFLINGFQHTISKALKCSKTIRVFDFINEIDEKNCKHWVELKYWICNSGFINKFYQLGKIVELPVKFHAQKAVAEIISSYLFVQSRWKKARTKAEQKQSSNRQPLNIRRQLCYLLLIKEWKYQFALC